MEQNDAPRLTELPKTRKYLCHKEVQAVQITEVIRLAGTTYLCFEGQERIMLSDDWVDRFGPKKGMYLVVYKDGYASVSPAEAFEEGYTLQE